MKEMIVERLKEIRNFLEQTTRCDGVDIEYLLELLSEIEEELDCDKTLDGVSLEDKDLQF